MTINELKNWMRVQLEQGNSIAVITAGQGGSGYALTNNEAIIADVDRYNTINIVDDEGEVDMLNKALVGDDELSNYESIVKLSNNKGEVLYILTDITSEQVLEQALIDYAINEASSDDVAQVLNVDADAIQSALVDFAEEWNEADEPKDGDAVIDKWVEFFTSNENPTDITLTKGGYGHDTLTWSYMGKDYDCTGEFYVDADNKLHHTFVAPSGREIEIVCDYE